MRLRPKRAPGRPVLCQSLPSATLVAYAALCLGLASGCISPTRNEDVPSEAVGLDKAGSKAATPPNAAAKPAPDVSTPTTDEELAFIRRQSRSDAAFGPDERQFVARLPPSQQPGSVAEAALAVGVIQSVLHPLGGPVDTFQEADLGHAQAAAQTASNRLSLEQLSRDHGLNFPQALSSNPLLGSAATAKQTVAALNRGGNSPAFKDAVGKALKSQASQWSDVEKDIPPSELPPAGPAALQGPPPAGGAAAGGAAAAAATAGSAAAAAAAGGALNGAAASGTAPGLPAPSTTAAAGTTAAGALTGGLAGAAVPAAASGTTPGAGALGAGVAATGAGVAAAGAAVASEPGGDNTLAQSQDLADRGDFIAAIAKAKSVPESHPSYAQAQEKVKDYSNLAVQELRRKAASAFQTAMPVSDQKTRTQYLKQAKAYLEEALKNYPDASQLPTVRENLRIITRDLEK